MGRLLGIALWVITVASVWMFVSGKWWFPQSISEHGPLVDRQFMITIIVVGIAFAAAQIGLGWVVFKYRDSAEQATRDLLAWQQPPGSGLDRRHGDYLHQPRRDGPASLGLASLARCAGRLASGQSRGPAVQLELSLSRQRHASFGRTDPNLIDDSALNYVGIDETDPNAKDDAVVSTLVIPANRPVELILAFEGCDS